MSKPAYDPYGLLPCPICGHDLRSEPIQYIDEAGELMEHNQEAAERVGVGCPDCGFSYVVDAETIDYPSWNWPAKFCALANRRAAQ